MYLDKSSLKKRFGEKLRDLRRQRGLSQEQLGELASMDRTYVSGCERGERNPTLETISRLAYALKVCPSTLIPRAVAENEHTGG